MSIALLLGRLLYNINLGKSVILSCSFHTVGDFVCYCFLWVLCRFDGMDSLWLHYTLCKPNEISKGIVKKQNMQ